MAALKTMRPMRPKPMMPILAGTVAGDAAVDFDCRGSDARKICPNARCVQQRRVRHLAKIQREVQAEQRGCMHDLVARRPVRVALFVKSASDFTGAVLQRAGFPAPGAQTLHPSGFCVSSRSRSRTGRLCARGPPRSSHSSRRGLRLPTPTRRAPRSSLCGPPWRAPRAK